MHVPSSKVSFIIKTFNEHVDHEHKTSWYRCFNGYHVYTKYRKTV